MKKKMIGKNMMKSIKTFESWSSFSKETLCYGNPTLEDHLLASKDDDLIKNKFQEMGWIEKIVDSCPPNDSEKALQDLRETMEMMEKASAEDITFARYVEDVSGNLPNLYLDLLRDAGYEETMEEYFRVASQIEPLLAYLKELIDRPRPWQLAKYHSMPLYPLLRTDAMSSSFPSGHALLAFTVSEYFSRKYPSCREILEAISERVANSRIQAGFHFPSDKEAARSIMLTIFQYNLIK